jgi:glycosyltransferase involved in cell wall biosynthesis
LTSAVVPLALSYHRPVIVPKYGCAIDMVGNAGILYDDCDPDGLINAMEQAVQLNRDHYKFLAQQRAKLFSWKLTAQQIAKAYEIACQT